MDKPLTEPKAWREIARRIAEGDWRREGMCAEVHALGRERQIPGDVLSRMLNRVDGHMRALDVKWSCLFNEYGTFGSYFVMPGNTSARVLAALFLALEAESES